MLQRDHNATEAIALRDDRSMVKSDGGVEWAFRACMEPAGLKHALRPTDRGRWWLSGQTGRLEDMIITANPNCDRVGRNLAMAGCPTVMSKHLSLRSWRLLGFDFLISNPASYGHD